jgi:murein DD-endopeptidase MepM/ murein hydrolase activator NlpD
MRFAIVFVLLLLLVPWRGALAQGTPPGGPVYIVQPGDTLVSIAFQFGISLDDLIVANQIANPNQIKQGDELVIPGLGGVSGVLSTRTMPFGESMRSLSRQYQVPKDLLVRLNRAVSPMELYVGSPVILPVQEPPPPEHGRVTLSPGQSLLELAVLEGVNPWTLIGINQLEGVGGALPGDILFVPDSAETGPGALPPMISSVTVEPVSLVQGRTGLVQIEAREPVTLTGQIEIIDLRNGNRREYPLHFFPYEDGSQVALQGLHAMAEPAVYPLTVEVGASDGSRHTFLQMIPLAPGGYYYDPPLAVPPETVDPDATEPEDALWASLTDEATPERSWSGIFQSPSPFGDCWTSLFGSRRSYNESPYNYFHTGLDFCGGTGIEITAPAPGEVVFAGPLVVRGNATVIDHGWGVYTGYMHQSEIMVEEGDKVQTGQIIGLVGGTGRVTGAHLHWEVWVGGAQVEPLEWLERVFP